MYFMIKKTAKIIIIKVPVLHTS